MKTAECVTPMHPDKLCDRISDAILDACLEIDPMSRVAVETMGGHGIITITGEITSNAYVDIREIARRITGNQYGVQVNIVKQSNEIANGVDNGGAGDQGIMVGYACRDNEEMIPQELFLARLLCKYLFGLFPFDGKTQITLNDKNQIETIVASFQNVNKEDLLWEVEEWIAKNKFIRDDIKIYCNPAGDWTLGGFEADTGVTGRKLAVDNYGPQIPIGGGAFSGKDSTKVDRSGAYKARQLAVRYLKLNKDSDECIVKLAYAIGLERPVMATVELLEKGHWIMADINFSDNDELIPLEIIKDLELRKSQFEKTAQWGHFGNDFLWDK